MNQTIEILRKRKSVREYENREVSAEVRAEILNATLRAPTAGNLTLYSILDVTDQSLKDKLVTTCDSQPFIATAPMVWIFLADYQRWYDYFHVSGVEELCAQKGIPMLKPQEGDLFLACCDALIAAQTAVVAAEALGLGSCYIGDIIENYETHRDIFNLPPYTFPIGMVVFGYPTLTQKERIQTPRFDQKFIVFENQYHSLDRDEFNEMFFERQKLISKNKIAEGIDTFGKATYLRKFSAEYSAEMRRSVREMLKAWKK